MIGSPFVKDDPITCAYARRVQHDDHIARLDRLERRLSRKAEHVRLRAARKARS